ncbi:hypothetical protein C8F01DRAFT_1098734 [Mycena amicta]|nr:hypothetical protein C8F01DRAFT_1098734 [Mycena amicta]
MASSSHIDGESILDFDGGVDDRESESSCSSSARSSRWRLDETRSHTSSLRQRVKNKLTDLSGGRVCILTQESAPQVSIKAAHLVPRATSGALLAKLEFSFGLKYKQLHIDTTGNLVYIRVDLHRSFDSKGWILLPETHVIQRIQQYMGNPGTDTYKQVCSCASARFYFFFHCQVRQIFAERKFTYRIIPLQLFKDETTVFQRVSKDEYRKLLPVEPFSPPTVESHANPFFVIANAGAKLEDALALLPTKWQFNPDILAVLGLWLRWKTVMPSPEWLRRPRSSPGRRAVAGVGPSGDSDTLARAAADLGLPQLDRDDSSDTPATESDILTHDAVSAVDFLDRSDFFARWLHGLPAASVPTSAMYS